MRSESGATRVDSAAEKPTRGLLRPSRRRWHQRRALPQPPSVLRASSLGSRICGPRPCRPAASQPGAAADLCVWFEAPADQEACAQKQRIECAQGSASHCEAGESAWQMNSAVRVRRRVCCHFSVAWSVFVVSTRAGHSQHIESCASVGLLPDRCTLTSSSRISIAGAAVGGKVPQQ